VQTVFLVVIFFDLFDLFSIDFKFSLRVKIMESNYAEENISTKQPPPREKAWLSRPDGDQERTRRDQTPPRQRSQEINSPALLSFRLPKRTGS